MRKEELLSFLKKEGATETILAETGCEYAFSYASSEAGISGYALITIKEGILALPYGAILPENGYEQFLLERAELISAEDVSDIIDDAEHMVKMLKTLHAKLLSARAL